MRVIKNKILNKIKQKKLLNRYNKRKRMIKL